MSDNNKSFILVVEFLAWFGLLTLQFYLSSLPTLPVPLPPFEYSDKLVHFVYFMLLGLLGFIFFSDTFRLFFFKSVRVGFWSAWLSFTSISIFGIIDEIRQLAVQGRSGSLGDIVADILGALAGCLLGVIFFREREKSFEGK